MNDYVLLLNIFSEPSGRLADHWLRERCMLTGNGKYSWKWDRVEMCSHVWQQEGRLEKVPPIYFSLVQTNWQKGKGNKKSKYKDHTEIRNFNRSWTNYLSLKIAYSLIQSLQWGISQESRHWRREGDGRQIYQAPSHHKFNLLNLSIKRLYSHLI